MISDRMATLRRAVSRDNNKMTQERFGEILGVSRAAIANIELGRVEPSELFIKLVCREFNVNEDWLRTGEGEMFNPTTLEEEIASAFGDVLSSHGDSFQKRFLAALASLPPDRWEDIESFALKLAPQQNNHGSNEGS